VSDAASELREELQGAVSPRYEVGEVIGRGGSSIVYRGWDTTEHQAVAFKVLTREYAATLGTARFLREIRLLTNLHHPGVLPLLDSGHSGTLLYFLMPLVEGETLQARLDREPQLPFELVQRILTQLAAALDHAHDAGVVHRDIKPSNLFLTGDRALLADFGIAKDLTAPAGESTTSTGLVMGTVWYMSPEQAGGNVHPDRRSDVYALGCVAYQMLAGEPPFVGRTTQAVITRHQTSPVPSVRLLRPDLHPGVDPVIRKALAKSPADRFGSAGEFAGALSDPEQLRAAARDAADRERPPRRWLWPSLLGVGLLAVALVLLVPRHRPLGPNKVVVFPLGETPPGAIQEGTGVTVALMIGSALEYTEPLEWIDGQPRLDARLRTDPGLLTAAEARRISRAAGARWYLDGTVVRRGDSVTVVLRLNDAGGDSVVGRTSATRVAPEAAQAGLEAVNQLLPRLVAPGQRMGDLSALAGRRPAAVAAWLQGEREYRSFNFAGALEYQRRAVKEDSALAIAAVRGSQAANWLNDRAEAGALSDVAVRHVSLLPGRTASFARGFHAYVNGQADSAVYWLTRALQSSPQWTEAHMSLGEVYYHLLPSHDRPLDSLAEAEFVAAAADTGFSPARFHLAEIAIRSGDTMRAKRAVQDFARLARDDASSTERTQLLLMLGCVRGGREGTDWKAAAANASLDVLAAAKLLAGGGFRPACAEDGFRAVFDNPSAALGDRWGAFLGLQGILAAEGRTSELRGVIDSAIAGGLDLASQLYVLDALAGVAVETDASAVVARATSDKSGKGYPFTLWLAGEWRAERNDRAGANAIREALAARAARERDPGIARFAEALGARVVLLQGDTAAAIDRLRAVLGGAVQDELDWGVGESLAPDRLLLAELLLARGQSREAITAAAVFDDPVPAVFLPYLPAGLAIRRQAALALGQGSEARRFEARLTALGKSYQLGSLSPSSTAEAP
jgi:tRNA A-37 threonylcarbamoyl transferase component Bud32